jgi:lipopolysaccharide transport system permease protein
MLLTYGWVFTAVLGVGTESVPYLTFAWAGLVVYSFVQQCLGSGVGVFGDSSFIVSKVYFPREILPLAVVGVACVDLSIAFLILVGVAWIQVGPPTVHLLGAVASVAVLMLVTAAATVVSAALAVRYRDIRHAMPLALRVLFIVSPVMYSVDLLTSRLGWVINLNPLVVVIEGVRDGVIRHEWPEPIGLAVYAVVGALALLVSLGVVRRAERLMTDRL